MHVVLIDDSIAFDGYTPASQPLGGAEKSFASLPAALVRRGHIVTVINQTDFNLTCDGAAWLPWDAPRPTQCDVLIAYRHPRLLDAVPADHRILWLASPAGYLTKPENRGLLETFMPDLVFMGALHRSTWNETDCRTAVIEPGVGEEFCLDDVATPAIPPYAVVTTHPLRGLDSLLDLWMRRIHPEVPEARLRIFSTALDRGRLGADVAAKLRPVFERAIRGLDHGVDIERPKADPEMAEAYRGARVHLYPGLDGEMYCATLAESQACGLPAVARPGGAVDERIEGGRTGYVVPDDDALVNVTLLLLRDDATHAAVSTAARERRRDRTWDAAAAEFEALWQ
jgi:hypothetical protein